MHRILALTGTLAVLLFAHLGDVLAQGLWTDHGLVQTGSVDVDEVISVRELRLRSGQTLILEDILPLSLLQKDPNPVLDQAAAAKLGQLVKSPELQLWQNPGRQDRYGRPAGHVRAADGAWLQRDLLLAGLAIAYPDTAGPALAADLYSFEDVARRARRGLWALNMNRLSHRSVEARGKSQGEMAGNPVATGRFVIVSGKIAEVSAQRRLVYLNFGPDWREDFTVGVEKSALRRRHPDWLKDLETWGNARVEVRGWLERYNGPFIRVTAGGQLRQLAPIAQARLEPGIN